MARASPHTARPRQRWRNGWHGREVRSVGIHPPARQGGASDHRRQDTAVSNQQTTPTLGTVHRARSATPAKVFNVFLERSRQRCKQVAAVREDVDGRHGQFKAGAAKWSVTEENDILPSSLATLAARRARARTIARVSRKASWSSSKGARRERRRGAEVQRVCSKKINVSQRNRVPRTSFMLFTGSMPSRLIVIRRPFVACIYSGPADGFRAAPPGRKMVSPA